MLKILDSLRPGDFPWPLREETNNGCNDSAWAGRKGPSARRALKAIATAFNRSTARCSCLETIAEAGGEATLTDLATRTGLNISTCHHLLATLIQRGFAAKVTGRRLYALGARILYLGHACLQVDLPRRAQPYLEKINAVTGETVHLAALQGDNVVDAGRARGAPCRAGRHRQASARWRRRTPPPSARRSWPGCRKTRCSACSPAA